MYYSFVLLISLFLISFCYSSVSQTCPFSLRFWHMKWDITWVWVMMTAAAVVMGRAASCQLVQGKTSIPKQFYKKNILHCFYYYI